MATETAAWRDGGESPNRFVTKAASSRCLLGAAPKLGDDEINTLDHHASDASGVSATLMRDRTTGEYTLSFRSTESAPAAKGGDRERDLFGADVEIGASGFAFGQLLAMEDYYQSLKTSGKLPAGAVLNVTGFSLGGHLATVFTELHDTDVNHTYIFNGAGRGHVPGEVPGFSAEETRIQDLLTYFRSALDHPDNALKSFPRDATYEQAKALYAQQGSSWRPFDQGAPRLYSDPRYEWAKAATLALFAPTGVASLPLPGEVQDQGPFAKITQRYGQATTDDLQFVANAGVHAPAIPVFIEGQPLIAGVPLPSFTESGNTHSIALIVDSLAVQDLIQTIDSRYGQASAELLIKAASNAKSDAVAPLNVSDVAEGDSLEKTVDAFRKLFVGPNPALDPLPVDSTVGGFGNPEFRNEFYSAIGEVRDIVTAKQAQGVVFTIDDLTDPALDHTAILAIADANTPKGLAYRYALKELNPFAVIADTEAANTALYAAHAQGGGLDLFDETTGAGTLTARYLDDRAIFLKEKVALNQNDREESPNGIHFKDLATGYEITADSVLTTDRQFIFDSDDSHTVMGDSAADELFGGGGHDVLIGQGGTDYLEGNAGNDILAGGAGDNDRLVGGAGFDTYLYNAGDGTDRIEDADGQNAILFDQQLLQGGIRPASGGANTSLDGRFTYAFSGTDLIVNGSLILKENFQNGQFGIRLVDLPAFGAATRTEYLTVDHYEQVGTDPNGNPIFEPVCAPFFDDNGNNTSTTVDPGRLVPPLGDDHNLIHALGGNDTSVSGAGDDQLYGDAGDDTLFGEGGHDRIFGGAGNDTINGDDSFNPVIGNDYLDGGEGDDRLQGSAGSDVILGGAGNDNLNGDDAQAEMQGTYGADVLDGGAGVDVLDGGMGDDLVHGGAGNDRLFADQGTDVLYGEDGDDYLNSGNEYLDTGTSVLIGGAGNDTYVVDSAADTVIEEAASGIDTVESVVNYTLPDNVEKFLATASGIIGTGNALGNEMQGNGTTTLDGRAGNDTLIDGRTYVFGHGYGIDTIVEHDPSSAPSFPGGVGDAVQFAADVLPSHVRWQRSGDDLILSLDSTSDQLLIPSFYTVALNQGNYLFSSNIFLPGETVTAGGNPSYVAPSQVEQFHFADGTIWGPEAFDAPMIGAYQANTYTFGRGSGQDTILDFDFTSTQVTDLIEMGADVLPSNLTVSRVGDNLMLSINGTTDRLTVQSYFASVFVRPAFSFSGITVPAYRIEQVQFADGTLWDAAAINTQLREITGTEASDFLQGNANANTILGLGGDDTLHGQQGADVLDGGAGNDHYRFDTGFGQDLLNDTDATQGNTDTVVFGTGINPWI